MILTKRLTDRETAAALKENAEKLRAVGAPVNISDLRYIKLAEYEEAEERKQLIKPVEESPVEIFD